MLAQVIKNPLVSFSHVKTQPLAVKFGDIVFVAKKKGLWCTIIHQESIYDITIDNLCFVNGPEDILTEIQVRDNETKQDLNNIAAIDSFFFQK